MAKARPRKPPKGADTGPVRTGPKRGDKGNPTQGGQIFGNWMKRRTTTQKSQ